jgi:hypothetical protein
LTNRWLTAQSDSMRLAVRLSPDAGHALTSRRTLARPRAAREHTRAPKSLDQPGNRRCARARSFGFVDFVRERTHFVSSSRSNINMWATGPGAAFRLSGLGRMQLPDVLALKMFQQSGRPNTEFHSLSSSSVLKMFRLSASKRRHGQACRISK